MKLFHLTSIARIVTLLAAISAQLPQDGVESKQKHIWGLRDGGSTLLDPKLSNPGDLKFRNFGPGVVGVWILHPNGTTSKMYEFNPGQSFKFKLQGGDRLYVEDEMDAGGLNSRGLWSR